MIFDKIKYAVIYKKILPTKEGKDIEHHDLDLVQALDWLKPELEKIGFSVPESLMKYAEMVASINILHKKTNWNLLQVLSWIALRDYSFFGRASNDANLWGSEEKELITPSGEVRKVEERKPRLALRDLDVQLETRSNINHQILSLDEANKELKGSLETGKIVALGIKNKNGGVLHIPTNDWYELDFFDDGNTNEQFVAKDKFFDQQRWYDVHFKREDVLKIWNKQEVLNPNENNKKLQGRPSSRAIIIPEYNRRLANSERYEDWNQEINHLYNFYNNLSAAQKASAIDTVEKKSIKQYITNELFNGKKSISIK